MVAFASGGGQRFESSRAYQLEEARSVGLQRKAVTTKQQLDELTKITASLAKNAESQDRRIASLLSTVESHDKQIASLAGSIESHDRQIARIIRALDKQRGVVNALAASVIAHDDQIEALGDRIDEFLNRLRPQYSPPSSFSALSQCGR